VQNPFHISFGSTLKRADSLRASEPWARFVWRRSTLAEEKPKEGPIPETEPGAENEELKEESAAKDKRIAGLTDDLKRLQAEFDNFKKRIEKDLAERTKLANQRLIGDLLPVLDSFDKAIEDAKKNEDSRQAGDGVQKLQRQFLRILEKEGLKEVRTDGKFDPFVHEALMREVAEDADDGKILEVFQKGYLLGNKTIRTAKVKVAKKKEPELPPQTEVAEAHTDSCDGTRNECLDDDME
jgi:molecular chaperone GrpE